MKKRLIAFLLVLIMVLGMLPASAFAADGDATKYTYTLYYKWNDGTDRTWNTDDTSPTAETSFTHYVNTATLPRNGYQHSGWADEANATTARYTGGEPIVLNKDNPTKTIYAIWLPIFELHYNANGGTGAPDSQTYTSYSATSTQATFTSRNQIPTKDGYTFKGWADSAAATTAQYQPGGTIPVKHENSPKTVYAVWEKNDSPVPDNPGGTKPDVANAQVKICVQCIEDSATHQPKNYGILPGAYVDGLLQVDGTYYYSITLNRAKYIEKFDQDSGKTHTDTEPNESIQFKWQWKNGKWELISDIAPVIKCQCEKQVEEKYTVTYTDGVDGKFFEDVVFSDLKSGVATPAFGKDPYHPGYTFAGWEPVVAATVTETVTYVAKWTPVEPKAPTADELKKLEMAVQVKCVVDDSQQHTAAYDLLGEYDEDYFVGEPRKDGDDWLCDINYYPERYVAEFNTTFQNLKHVQNDEKIVPVTLIWDGGSWQLKTQGRVHVTEVYTVTYTDGVENEEVFADQVYSDLRKDSATPAFNGTPTRTGYTFAGWEPEVAETVTETVTYAAKWTPVEPTHDDIFKALNGLVTVTCINRFWKDGNKNMDCGQGQYAAKAGIAGQEYTLEKGENAGTWVVTFPVTNFVKSFKQDPAHNLYTKDTLRWYIRWENNAWTSAPVEPGVDDLVKLTHAPTTFDEVTKFIDGRTDVIKTSCVNGETATCAYGLMVAFVNPDHVVSVEQEKDSSGQPIRGSYIATLKMDQFAETCAKACNNKSFADAPRTHKLLTQETVQWRLYATSEADEKIGNNVLNHVWEAEPVKAGKDDVCTIAHNWVVTFNPDNGGDTFKQNVEYEGKAIKPTPDPEKTGYTFDGWYLDEAEAPFSFDTTITSDITLTAKWHVTPHNIYAYARLNSYFAPLTTSEFDTPVTLNEATLSRLGLGSYNSLGYISIGSFTFDAMPLTSDLYFADDAELSAVAEKLATDIALETGVSDKIAEKIAWMALYKTVNEEDMAPGYPAEAGYQLSGNLNLASVTFRAGAENVENMPAVNYTYDDGAIDFYDFYFAGDTITLPTTEPTREGYSFKGWSVKVLPAENDADHLDADGADDAADETLLKAGDTYTITAGGVIFTAQWKLNTYIIASDLRINGDTANLADGKTYAWTHRYGGNYGETIDYQPMFDALKARALAVDAANEPYDAEIKLCFPGNKNKLFNETILTYGQEGGGWNPGVKNTAYIWGYATTSYEVIFNSDGGSAVDTQIVKYGEKAVKPEDPTMKGYNFLGWFDKDGNPFDFDTEITHKTELKAQWEKKDYIIASDLRINGDTANLADGKDYPWTHRYGGKYEETIDYQPMFDALKARALEADKDNEPNPTKVDVELRFPGSSNLFNETILTYGQDGANWQAANNTAYIWGYAWTYYDVTFVTPEGATTVDAQLIKNGDCAAKPADPTKEGWKFLGWYADAAFKTEFNFDAPITKKTSVYAKFELTSTPIGDIYVRYDVLHIKQLPDGTYDLANAEVEHLSAKKDTTVTAVIKDYRATHHVNVNRTLSKLTGTAIQPYKGVDGKPVYTILSVYYDLDFHTLTFDTMGGSKIAPETVRHGLTVAKPKDPVNGGYWFDGWYTDKTYRTPYNFATPLTQDTTIYAKWFLIVLPGVTDKKATPKLNTSDHFAYVQGYPNGTVKPAGNITRAETAAILFRLMDDASRKTYYSTKSGFRDVASGSWYNTYVATLNNAGVITDSSNGYFRPNEAITRAELAAMLAKFSETTGAANYFNDVSAKYWAANAIAICAKLGWITGYPDGTFRPDKNVTRAELMAMINRATGRAPKSADAFLPGMKTWSDNTADKWYYLDVQEATNSHSYTVKGSETWTALTSDPNWSLYE